MSLYIKKNTMISFLFIAVLSILVYYCNSKIIKFFYVTLLFLVILNKAKFSFFSVLTFILLFTLFQEFMLETFNIGTGMLITGTEASNSFLELYLCTNIFCAIEFLFIDGTNIIENEKKMYLTNIFMTDFWAISFTILSLIITILIFPTFPTFKTTLVNRFNSGIIPFSGFAGLVLLLVAITYDSAKKLKFIYIIDFFIVFWFIGHAERVEALGLIVYLILKYLNQNSLGLHSIFQVIKKHYKLGIVCILGVGFLIWIGITRTVEHSQNISLEYLLSRILIQSTASDVAYIFNCSVDLWKNGDLLNGYTYLSYLSELMPFGANISTSEMVIKEYYFTVGGCPFFAEIIMNFGILGIIPIITLFFSIHYFIVRKANEFKAVFWIPIVIEIFRTAWYGWTGWFTLSFWVTPILYLIITRLKIAGKSYKYT
ncbi:MAG: O-antigen polymerase [Clostridium butyricum]